MSAIYTRIENLIQLQLKDRLSPQEQMELGSYMQDPILASYIHKLLDEAFQQEQGLESLNEVQSTQILQYILPERKAQSNRFGILPRIAAVAALILAVIGIALYVYNKQPKESLLLVQELEPGKNGATLILADGKRIRLSDAGSGTIAEEVGVSISKSVDGQLIYELKENGKEIGKENTLSTSNGETYQVRLPDGTQVWLNAGSSLTYTPKLIQEGQRKVKLVGEAYFEVAKDKYKPFIVQTGNQQVEVLGTSFNINAYLDEPMTRTTLVEGSIKIKTENGELLVRPGEQAINTGNALRIIRVDTENITDWKDGDFYLNHVDFKVAMRKIARWYDVDVVYDGSVPEGLESGGWIARDRPLSQVLKSIESSGMVRFRIEGRTIHVIR